MLRKKFYREIRITSQFTNTYKICMASKYTVLEIPLIYGHIIDYPKQWLTAITIIYILHKSEPLEHGSAGIAHL